MSTIKSMRLHIGIFGRTNAGKSTLLNTITNQQVAIVSDEPGTTTDPIEKPMELKPFGPVLFIDTAGLFDRTILGEKRIAATQKYFDRCDIAILVAEGNSWSEKEQQLILSLREKKIPFCVILTKIKSSSVPPKLSTYLDQEMIPYFVFLLSTKIEELLANLIRMIHIILPENWLSAPKMIGDFIKPGDFIVLVIPIDKEAPMNRIILPQQQAIREVLDEQGIGIVTTVEQLPKVIQQASQKPTFVVTDSQAFKKVFNIVPRSIPVTGFSILLARIKGDLDEFIQGIHAIKTLKDGDKVLILEACSHNPLCNDIGREQIPQGIQRKLGCKLTFDISVGHDFPDLLANYKLMIHCGACLLNRKEVLYRIAQAKNNNVPITNYGLVLSYLSGDLERALEIFV